MKVVFKRAWQQYSVGAEISPPAMLRGWLISQGYVDPVKVIVEAKPEPKPVEAAIERPRKSKRVIQTENV